MADAIKNEQGKYDAYAWPGGYPIFYVMGDCEVICPACANGENGSEASADADDKQWRIAGADINWEDESMYCAHCNKKIEAAYAD